MLDTPLTKAGHFDDDERKAAIAYILSRVCCGRSVRAVLIADAGNGEVPRLPGVQTWWRWVAADAALSEHLARAREAGIEALLDEIIDIADDMGEDSASRRVRIDARIRLAQMMKPRKYGPSIDLTSNGQTLGLAEQLAARRKRAIEERDAPIKISQVAVG